MNALDLEIQREESGGSEAFSEPLFLLDRSAAIKNIKFFQKNPKVFETPADIYIRYKCTQVCVR